jgi:hypothetical protein
MENLMAVDGRKIVGVDVISFVAMVEYGRQLESISTYLLTESLSCKKLGF